MKKILLVAAILCGVSSFADEFTDDAIQYQMLYWQIGNGYAAENAVGGALYATVGTSDEKIYLAGYETPLGEATGVRNETILVQDGVKTYSSFSYQEATFFFELIDSEYNALSTSQGFAFSDFVNSGAFAIDYAGLAKPSVSPSAPFTAYAMIPEPTSGLLMLFGLAGLALRRKRA